MKKRYASEGFTLIEMLLVMVIISMIIYALIGYTQRRAEQMRIDKTSLQTQQILNAAMAYYVDHGSWPSSIADRLQGSYLPSVPKPFLNPWQQAYQSSISTVTLTSTTSSQPMYYVYSKITSTRPGLATLDALQIAGALPLAYTTSQAGSDTAPPAVQACASNATECYVVASVSIPGQNLNNANAVTFAGLYKHGGCVPQPQCPPNMSPQIFVIPVSVSGINDVSSGSPVVYPITSFTAYATPISGSPPTTSPPLCGSSSGYPINTDDCTQTVDPNSANVKAFWRVCLQVVTQKGESKGTGSGAQSWGQYVSLLAITRCSINNEPSGSGFNVYFN